MADKHSIYSPSSSSRWLACPGSIRMCEGLPNDSSDASEEGTDAHELAALCLTLGADAASFIGKELPCGNVVDKEMADNVQVYLDYVGALPGTHLVETWVDLSRFTDEEGGGGTSDHIAMADATLYVTDYKNGYTPVAIEGNTQLRMYAAGALDRALHAGQSPAEIVMAIVQPRVSSTPLIEVIPVEELIFWVESVLVPGCDSTREPDAMLSAGEKQCKWCLAKGHCPALAEGALALADTSLATIKQPFVPPAPITLADSEIAAIMDKVGLMRSWLDAIEKEALARLESGHEVPNWKLVRGKKGNRTWSPDVDEDAIVAVLRENYGLANETIYKQTLLSPSAMFDLPVVKENPDLLKVFVTQKEGAICAAPASDKRPAIVTHEAIAAQFTTVD